MSLDLSHAFTERPAPEGEAMKKTDRDIEAPVRLFQRLKKKKLSVIDD
jgi:hypothetical protein